MNHTVESGSEEEKALLKRLNGISASSVLYGAGKKYTGDRGALSREFGEEPIDVSVLWLLDSYGQLDMSLYDPSDLEDILEGSGPAETSADGTTAPETNPPETVPDETTAPETTAPETVPAETTDDDPRVDYDDILPAYVCGAYTFLDGDGVGDSYTVYISENDGGTGGKYSFSVTFDVSANDNDFIIGTMDLGEIFRFDGSNSIDEGELCFTFEENKLYLTFSSKLHPKFKSVLEPKQKIDYTKIDFGNYCGTYFMPNGECSITISDFGDEYYVDMFFDEDFIVRYDSGTIVPGESNLLDGGTMLTLEVSFDGRLHASIISAVEADGSYDGYLTKTNTMCEHGLTFEEESEKLSYNVSKKLSELNVFDLYCYEGSITFDSARITVHLNEYSVGSMTDDTYFYTVDYISEDAENERVILCEVPAFCISSAGEEPSGDVGMVFNLGDYFSEYAGIVVVSFIDGVFYLASNIENCADTGGQYVPVDLN